MILKVLWLDDDAPRFPAELSIENVQFSIEMASAVSVAISKLITKAYNLVILDFYVPLGDPSAIPDVDGITRSFTTIDLVRWIRMSEGQVATAASTPAIFFSMAAKEIEKQILDVPAAVAVNKAEVSLVEALRDFGLQLLMDDAGPNPGDRANG